MARKSTGTRPLRVGEAVRHSVAELFARGDLAEPDLYGESLTVTEVAVSPDLRHATLHVAVLGERSASELAAVETALMRSAGEVRTHIARTVKLRYVPAVRLVLDRRFEQADALDEVFAREEVRRDLDPEAADDTEEER